MHAIWQSVAYTLGIAGIGLGVHQRAVLIEYFSSFVDFDNIAECQDQLDEALPLTGLIIIYSLCSQALLGLLHHLS